MATDTALEARKRIRQILADDQLDEGQATESINALIDVFDWGSIKDYMMEILRDHNRASKWRIATHIFWGAVLEKRELPTDELIAWLYYRFDPQGQNEDNEVWSITCKLKGVDYLSDYNPLNDPNVLHFLEVIQRSEYP